VHPLVEGIEEICGRYRLSQDRERVFDLIYRRTRENWLRSREPGRWPSQANWVLRVAPQFTPEAGQRLEKQLQKQIATCLEHEGWGNDVPTASGLVNSRGRQMNVDLAHRVAGGFEFIELKWTSNTPYDAAMQILRYGAIYMLYRLDAELKERFREHAMLQASRIGLEVLAPAAYYDGGDVDLQRLEIQLNASLAEFTERSGALDAMTFRFRAFPRDFVYKPGMDCAAIRHAVSRRSSPLAAGSEAPDRTAPRRSGIEILSQGGQRIRTFDDWAEHALPPERRAVHWKEGRSAFELGRVWAADGEPAAPAELLGLLESHPHTRGASIRSGITERETALPFGERGPRCHDLLLRAERGGRGMVISIEAKADEPFGGIVMEELRKARARPATLFPQRLDCLTRSLLGVPAFKDSGFNELAEEIATLRYQLLAAIAGTLIEAELENAAAAVFVVHEFRTGATTDAKMKENGESLDRFVHVLRTANGAAEGEEPLRPGRMAGPIQIAERGETRIPCGVPLYVGKIRTDRKGPGG
jgi:hypothetical protein